MHRHDIVSIIASVPPEFFTELQQFAIDNNIVSAKTRSPKVSSAIAEICRIATMGETDEERQFIRVLLGFRLRKTEKKGVPKIASTILEIAHIFLKVHRSPVMKDIREAWGVTTLEIVSFIFDTYLQIYRAFGIRGHNIVNFFKETENAGLDPHSEMAEFFTEIMGESLREYMGRTDYLSIEYK